MDFVMSCKINCEHKIPFKAPALWGIVCNLILKWKHYECFYVQTISPSGFQVKNQFMLESLLWKDYIHERKNNFLKTFKKNSFWKLTQPYIFNIAHALSQSKFT
jgi:hypothetical protein